MQVIRLAVIAAKHVSYRLEAGMGQDIAAREACHCGGSRCSGGGRRKMECLDLSPVKSVGRFCCCCS